MGLDASVYCNCYATGRVKSPPPFKELVYVDTDGDTYIHTDDDSKYFAVEDWKKTACAHEDMILIHRRLGNMSGIGQTSSCIKRLSQEKGLFFPVLLNKVLYSGTHACDQLDLPDVKALAEELEIIKNVRSYKIDKVTRRVINDLTDLCDQAMVVKNPIVF